MDACVDAFAAACVLAASVCGGAGSVRPVPVRKDREYGYYGVAFCGGIVAAISVSVAGT